MINTYYDLQYFEAHACDYRYTEELTNVDLSPLNNPKYNNIKLIMGCPENPSVDTLIQNGNLRIQEIVADYRQLYATTDMAIIQSLRNRLDYNMSGLRTILNNCYSMKQ